ncbi:hypothetical protein EXN65_11235 [Clostridium botulinum]|uniref:Transmembrane protein n=2 Tax=Clostridium botulinum TaxID=1491 RepID=A0A846I0R4_CLOBO|nr:hypothetical protein [Clostridium botulinum]ACQ51985.1 conserved hypothetical protein [Clostridium botulinum Ba4 str. 657]AJE11910.1 hypothetical protein T259_294 [Clostridium botulinum CDC_1436]AXG92675.1 hypothetical protein AGE29_13130 [Clostridium botulinum]EDT86482.1 conserved hypothetical protein [Clostridium botulinum Bf]MBY6882031.1 hypothetical protein [Clostridium botulinum]
MAQKKNYSRYFIILEEDEKGYSLGVDKSASGYVKLENKNGKCKISYYVQNIKKQSSPYHMVLICNKKGTKDIIKIGEMNIDEYGRADICYEYPVDNIGNSEINADKISGAAIVKFIDSNIISVMSGFSTTDIPAWKSFSIIESKERKKEDIKEEKVNKTIFDKYEETIEEIKIKGSSSVNKDGDNKIKSVQEHKEKNLHNEIREKGKDIKESNEKDLDSEDREKGRDIKEFNEKDLDNEGREKGKDIKEADEKDLDSEDKERDKDIEKPNEKNLEKAKKSIEKNEDKKRNKQNIPVGLEGKYFRSLVEDLDSVGNITDEIKNCIWYKIDAKNEDDMRNTCNYDKFMVLYNPMLGYYPYIKKHGHYILGYKCDISGNMKYLVYGIPGDKTKEEQPFKGKSGFVTWIENKENNLGYWLMFYDYKTNNILIPVK